MHLVRISGQVSHSEVETVAQKGSVVRRLELEEELAGGPHYGAGQIPDPAEGPDQRGKLVHAVVYLEKNRQHFTPHSMALVQEDST